MIEHEIARGQPHRTAPPPAEFPTYTADADSCADVTICSLFDLTFEDQATTWHG